MANSKHPQSRSAAKQTTTRRYWHQREGRLAAWWPWGWLPVFGLIGAFAYGALQTAPAIEAQTAEQVRLALDANGVRDFQVHADGQEVLVRAAGSEADGALVRALAGSVACDTWVAGRRVCPNSVRVQMTAPVEVAIASAGPAAAPRLHDFSFTKRDGALVLTGEVPDGVAQTSIVMAAAVISDNVVDELNVSNEPATDAFDWAVDRAWPILSALAEGEVAWRDGLFTASGRAIAGQDDAIRSDFATVAYRNRLGTLRLEPAPIAELCNQRFADALSRTAIQFATGSAEISPASRDLLNELAALAGQCPINLSIEGHTDNVGLPEGNRSLSLARAEAVLAALVDLGVESSRLSANGFGSNRPIADNSTRNGRARNRRIEIRAVEDQPE